MLRQPDEGPSVKKLCAFVCVCVYRTIGIYGMFCDCCDGINMYRLISVLVKTLLRSARTTVLSKNIYIRESPQEIQPNLEQDNRDRFGQHLLKFRTDVKQFLFLG